MTIKCTGNPNWVKGGKSPNPKGRPKHVRIPENVKEILANASPAIILLKSLLVPDGILVQWDWLSPSNESDFGLTEEIIESTYKDSGLNLTSVNKSFSLTSSKGTMSVLMAVAKNA